MKSNTTVTGKPRRHTDEKSRNQGEDLDQQKELEQGLQYGKPILTAEKLKDQDRQNKTKKYVANAFL